MGTGSVPASWVAARTHPASYPGDHPPAGFALVDDRVVDLVGSGPTQLDVDDGSLTDLLARRGLAQVEDRVPVLAYGANRNPATLELKLRHYGYRSPGDGTVLPVIPARVRGLDVVAGGLSSQGYVFADLHSDELTSDTEICVHVLLLDDDQLRVMHESEGIHTGLYDVGVVEGVDLVWSGGPPLSVPVLAYLGATPVFVSPVLGTPLAVAAVRARGRRLAAFDNVGLLVHALEACDLVGDVAAVVAPGADPASMGVGDVAVELMKFLNGQWWYRRHTGDPRLRSCEALEALIVNRLQRSSAPVSARDRLAGVERILPPDEALRPGPALRLGRR